ncbi:MAG: 5-formyltetrahydrofolate cyclo-ligase [Desulfobacteraceae bacterium]|nr:5-formyltetrahydrofolate cyclo-ligase [Desulfobacteraceae bacterium]MBC2754075.1 5-formyltetrahydrofolate cyclo-ligase [Desulfobacteraceae bacterium]
MEDLKVKKQEIRSQVEKKLDALSKKEIKEKYGLIEEQLFDFANFREAEVTLLYVNHPHEVDSKNILKYCSESAKDIVLPLFTGENNGTRLYKINDIEKDLKPGPNNILEPDPNRCKPVPIDDVDIAIIPGIAFDEKGGRLGIGNGRYDRIISKLPVTARKVACATEDQMTQLIPMESHDKYVDIIITDKRIIYKI